jgi:hypothetical protein
MTESVNVSNEKLRWSSLFALAVGFPAAIYLASTVGFVSRYSSALYNRRHFLHQYDHGVYRYRVLGREAVLGAAHLANLLGLKVTSAAIALAQGHATWSLLSGETLFNGACFLFMCVVLYVHMARRPGWVAPYLVLVSVAGMAGYVVTPYDDLRNLLIVIAFVVAWRARWWAPLRCALLMGAAVATHEAAFVLLAGLAALIITTPISTGTSRPQVWRHHPLTPRLVAAAAGGIVTYVALHVALAPSSGTTLIQHVRGVSNLNESGGWATIIAVLGAAAVLGALPRRPSTSFRHQALTWTAVLALPYLVVAAVGGNLFEAPRLILPLVLVMFLVARAADDDPALSPDYSVASSSGPSPSS